LVCTARGQSSNVDEANFVELPPELCLDLGVPSSVIRSLYLVPSVMHRLNSLVLAGQLRKVIREERPKCPLVPATLVRFMHLLINFVCTLYLGLCNLL
jgi:endoribonuclease Dicer